MDSKECQDILDNINNTYSELAQTPEGRAQTSQLRYQAMTTQLLIEILAELEEARQEGNRR